MQKVLNSAQPAIKNYLAIAFSVRSACGILTTRKEKTNKIVMNVLRRMQTDKSILKIGRAEYQTQLENVFKNTKTRSGLKVKL